ncbi:MAG: DUF983 domain-containing protein [Alphaproteobacteria bacterium]|nr:DUF983 domain-containing protein [Alphaproteobacteria bacterium]
MRDIHSGHDRAPRALWTSIGRTMRGRCPSCGEGKLFRSFLRQVDRCSACGEDLGRIRADDAPPWATILIVGHIVVPLLLAVESRDLWAAWIGMLVWPSLALALSVLILPHAKAAFIGLIWATRAPGSGDA